MNSSRLRLLAILVFPVLALASPPPPPAGYVWVRNEPFSDEFDGDELDREKWNDYHPVWEGRPPAKFIPEAISVFDGHLRIRNGTLPKKDRDFTLFGGAVTSKSHEAFHGYYEVRMKASKISMSSTFWLMRVPDRIGNAEVKIELDIVEAIGAPQRWPEWNNFMKSNTHVFYRADGEEPKNVSSPGEARIDPASGEAFHVYAAWWVDPNTVRFYVDDEYRFTLHPPTDHSPTPFDRPMFLNLVTETYNWETPPTAEAVNNPEINTTLYDWVRSYTLVPAGKADSAAIVTPARTDGFPFMLPNQKPDRPLSAAMERLYENYGAPRPEDNELYSLFKYTELKGFDYNGNDGTMSRRDPSKVILENGKYYVWYTHRHTPTPPQGPDKCTDTIPSADWDLSDIWYATSEDGVTWKEQGVAVPRPPKPNVGWRSVTTTDILKWKGKYYLYYQGFMEASGTRGDNCPVAVSYADSPDGPWKPHNKIVIPNGSKGEWDQFSIHDPYPLVYKDRIYLYYKSDSGERGNLVRMQGLAIADNPLGPFVKHPFNPVMNSGHETTMFPFKEGIAALVIRDGTEHFTIQYAEDGVNFEIASITSLMPDAAGPYIEDAFTNTKTGRGITWGISHFTTVTTWEQNHAILTRFDCDLSLDIHDVEMKRAGHSRSKPDYYYKHYGLTQKQRERIGPAAKADP